MADLMSLYQDAKNVAFVGSKRNNPEWGDDDFTKFAEFAAKINPVLECTGRESTDPQMMAKATVPEDDVEYLWAMCMIPQPHIIAQKRFLPGEKSVMEFEIPRGTAFVILFQKSLTNGVWMSNPYIKVNGAVAYHKNPSLIPGAPDVADFDVYDWEVFLNHETGACATAPKRADQYFPQCHKHPELLWESQRRVNLKILYLHGHANNQEIGRRQVDAMQSMLNTPPNIDILPGNVKLTEKKHFASVIDYSPQLVDLGLSGTAGYQLEGYGHIESPATDPDNDPTCQTNCEGVKWAKMSHESMRHAVQKLKEKVIAEDGYDVIAGFSQGGEVLQQFLNELPEVNKVVSKKVKMFCLFGARTYYKKYGPLTAHFKPEEMKGFIAMGLKDSEDTKDATRDTDNLWDLSEFRRLYEAHGIHVRCESHQGGHEMPDTKVNGVRGFWNRFWDFYWQNPDGTGDLPAFLPSATGKKSPFPPGYGSVNELLTVGTFKKK